MKVIRLGTPERVIVCMKCNSELAYLPKDIKEIKRNLDDTRAETYTAVICPVCNQILPVLK